MPFAQFLQGARPFSYTHLVLPLRQRTQAPPALRAVDRTTPEDMLGDATGVAGNWKDERQRKREERKGERCAWFVADARYSAAFGGGFCVVVVTERRGKTTGGRDTVGPGRGRCTRNRSSRVAGASGEGSETRRAAEAEGDAEAGGERRLIALERGFCKRKRFESGDG